MYLFNYSDRLFLRFSVCVFFVQVKQANRTNRDTRSEKKKTGNFPKSQIPLSRIISPNFPIESCTFVWISDTRPKFPLDASVKLFVDTSINYTSKRHWQTERQLHTSPGTRISKFHVALQFSYLSFSINPAR